MIRDIRSSNKKEENNQNKSFNIITILRTMMLTNLDMTGSQPTMT